MQAQSFLELENITRFCCLALLLRFSSTCVYILLDKHVSPCFGSRQAIANPVEGFTMTPEEHQLILEMLKQQRLLYAGLVELLKSRGIVSRGDLEAFDDLVSTSSREFLERN